MEKFARHFWHLSVMCLMVTVLMVAQTSRYDLMKTQVTDNTVGSTSTQTTEEEDGENAESQFPKIDKQTRIEPSMSYPGGTVEVQVYVFDPDGENDINGVTVNLYSLNLGQKQLTRGKIDNGGQWFDVEVQLPSDIKAGTYTIEILATDKSGKSAYAKRDLSVVNDRDKVITTLRAPQIVKIYTDPEKINVGVTEEVFIFAEIRDEDGTDDIKVVQMDLEGLGRDGSQAFAKVENIDRFTDLYGTKIIDVDFLNPEDAAGFAVDVFAYDTRGGKAEAKHTMAVTSVTDANGNVSNPASSSSTSTNTSNENSSPSKSTTSSNTTTSDSSGLHGSAGTSSQNTTATPAKTVERPIPLTIVGPNIIEVKLPEPLHIPSFRQSGDSFQIAEHDNIFETVRITKATLDATAQIVRLYTTGMDRGQYYVLWTEGIKMQSGKEYTFARRPIFKYEPPNTQPLVLEQISILDANHIEVQMSKPLEFSSVIPTGEQCTIRETGSQKKLAIYGIEHINDTTVEIETDTQEPYMNYTLVCEDFRGAGGTSFIGGMVIRSFKGFREGYRSDLDHDGDIDFVDFTIFTSDYARYSQNSSN